MPFPFKIQMLDVIVDPTIGALLMAGDPFNDPFYPDAYQDITANTFGDPIRNPPPGRYIRNGGSGTQPNRKDPPKIVTENSVATIGDSASNIDVLLNDRYSGTPTIKIIAWTTTRGKSPVKPPANSGAVGAVWTSAVGATATIFNEASGSASRLRYTPPASGGALEETIYYKLTATGSSKYAKGFSTVDVNVPELPFLYTGVISYADGDGIVDVTLDLDSGPTWTWSDLGPAFGPYTVTITPGGATFTIAGRASNSSGWPPAGAVTLEVTGFGPSGEYVFTFV